MPIVSLNFRYHTTPIILFQDSTVTSPLFHTCAAEVTFPRLNSGFKKYLVLDKLQGHLQECFNQHWILFEGNIFIQQNEATKLKLILIPCLRLNQGKWTKA